MRLFALLFALPFVLLFQPPAHAAAPIAGCHPDQIATLYPALAGKTLIMGADPQTPPYASLDPKNPGKLTGSDIELATAVFNCIGAKYEIRPAAWSGLLPAVASGQIDLMYYLYYTPQRAKEADFIVYMKAGTGALTQAGNPKHITSQSEADLCGNTVAVGLGAVEEAEMTALSAQCTHDGKKPVAIMTYSDHAAGFRLIASGRADIMLTDLALVDKTVQDNPKIYSLAYGVISGFQIGVAVKKGNKLLEDAILNALKAVQADGVEKAIFVKYGVDPSLELPAQLRTQ